MEIIGTYIYDKRVASNNYLLKMSVREYYELTRDILDKNEFQRTRVTSSKTIYSLLKEDLKKGCLIPSIVLALPSKNVLVESCTIETLQIHKNDLIILDGLQRTYTIGDLYKELKEDTTDSCLDTTYLRVEVYWGISRSQILYRMLTLNTGHTPMSTRHQIEIVYADLLNDKPDGVTIIKETDNIAATKVGEYSYKNVIDGFTSFVEKNYLPIDREDILKTVKNLDTLSFGNSPESDLFNNYLSSYDRMVKFIASKSENWKNEDKSIENPFGKNVPHLFGKAQSLAGFGAALGHLFGNKDLLNFEDVKHSIDNINQANICEALNSLNQKMEIIKEKAKKIGNDQRFFFFWLYRKLFDPNNESKLDFYKSVEDAFERYARDTF
jgi:hypothetical protein